MTKVKFNLYFLVVFGFERSLLQHAQTFPQVTAQNLKMFFKYYFYSFKTTYDCRLYDFCSLDWCDTFTFVDLFLGFSSETFAADVYKAEVK